MPWKLPETEQNRPAVCVCGEAITDDRRGKTVTFMCVLRQRQQASHEMEESEMQQRKLWCLVTHFDCRNQLLLVLCP